MKLNKLYTHIFLLLGFCFLFNCTEEIQLSTENFKNVLVVEATITDEFKTQEVKVTSTFLLESDTPVFDAGASVQVATSSKTYNFHHVGEGVFYSDEQFQAIKDESYKLLITTSDGKKYYSNSEVLAPKAELENLYAELGSSQEGSGVYVLVDSNNDLDGAAFFRYEYEETYKIVSPYFRFQDISISNIQGVSKERTYDIDIVERPADQQNCYSTNTSTEILLMSVSSLSENRVSRFPIKFISENSPFLRDRYSILVKQYVQSADANNFYKILKELGGDSESVFVTNQPGFVQGNIFSEESLEEKVIGFFDVSTVTSKRIYFNYADFNFVLPPYYFDCEVRLLDYDKVGSVDPYQLDERSILLTLLTDNPPFKYISGFGTLYEIVDPECGDCSTFASNIKPEFWED